MNTTTDQQHLPSISILIIGRNCSEQLRTCVVDLQKQNYPKDLIEILYVDGDSSDNSKEVAEETNITFIAGGFPDNPEARRYVALKAAKNEIIAWIDTDNFLPHENWLKNMVIPFITNQSVVGSFTKWYGFDKNTSSLNIYFALIGGNDPVSFYLNKNDRVPYMSKKLPCGAVIKEKHENFDLIEFPTNDIPTIGCNGFLCRRSFFNMVSYDDPERCFHTDINLDVMDHANTRSYAIVNDTLIHLTSETLLKGIKKRMSYMGTHHVKLSNYRKYNVFNSSDNRDRFKLVLCLIYAFTFIEPLARSVIGYINTGHKEWFYHPVVTFINVVGYGVSVLKSLLNK